MPTCSSSTDLVKSCRHERLHVSHKAIAGRAWIDGIRFDHGSTTLLGVLHRCFDDLSGQSLSTQVSTNEEAGQRPYLLGQFANPVRATKITVGWPRRDRAPCNGLPFGIAQQSDRRLIADVLMYRKFAIHALVGFRACSPNHAPAGFRATSALEQALKISPARGVYFVKLQFGHAHSDTSTAPAFNVAIGSFTSFTPRQLDVCFTPESHRQSGHSISTARGHQRSFDHLRQRLSHAVAQVILTMSGNCQDFSRSTSVSTPSTSCVYPSWPDWPEFLADRFSKFEAALPIS